MQRVAPLRAFKDRLIGELARPRESSYYLRSPETRGFAAMQDFDTLRLQEDMAKAFPSLRPWLVRAFVGQAIYQYYLR
jgi:hypothetical protein